MDFSKKLKCYKEAIGILAQQRLVYTFFVNVKGSY